MASIAAGCARTQGVEPARTPKERLVLNATPAPETPTTTTTWPAAPPGWTVVSVGPRGVTAEISTVVVPSGRSVVVARFPAATTALHLHVGSEDPPGAASEAPVDAGSAVDTSDDEAALLVAAFNGGFKEEADAGGVEVDGTTVSPLVQGDASAVIDADGSLHIGAWGSEVPTPGEPVVDVRQNLDLLVDNASATPASSDESLWGLVLGSSPVVARSALGVDRQGDVLYAASMGALPSDLAAAMVDVGAMRAMELDINPFWVTLGTASVPGAALTAQIPGENHSPTIFTSGWERDFFSVLAQPRQGCHLVFPTPAGVGAPDPATVMCGPPHESPAPSTFSGSA